MRFEVPTRLLAVAVLIALTGCARQPAVTVPPPPDRTATARAAWTDFSAAFIESYFKAQPFFAVQSGRHEFDGQMPDWSAAAFEKEIDRLKQLRSQAQGFDAGPLDPAQQFEREYVLSIVDKDLFWLEQARAPFNNPAWYLDRLDPEVYLSRDYAPLEKRLAGYLGYARAIPQLTAQIRANLHSPLAKPLIDRGIDGFGGFAAFFRNDVAKVFAPCRTSRHAKSWPRRTKRRPRPWTN
jgi:hypothetical protein